VYGSDVFQTQITFGVTGKYRAKKKSILKRMNAIVEKVLEYYNFK
jgi:hypothetical protein